MENPAAIALHTQLLIAYLECFPRRNNSSTITAADSICPFVMQITAFLADYIIANPNQRESVHWLIRLMLLHFNLS